MPKAYVIFTESIHDPAGMRAYEAASTAPIVEHGAKVLAVDPGLALEGVWPGDRTVLLEFASVEAARAWYDSAAYQAVVPLRHAAATTNAVILTGFTAPAA